MEPFYQEAKARPAANRAYVSSTEALARLAPELVDLLLGALDRPPGTAAAAPARACSLRSPPSRTASCWVSLAFASASFASASESRVSSARGGARSGRRRPSPGSGFASGGFWEGTMVHRVPHGLAFRLAHHTFVEIADLAEGVDALHRVGGVAGGEEEEQRLRKRDGSLSDLLRLSFFRRHLRQVSQPWRLALPSEGARQSPRGESEPPSRLWARWAQRCA